MSLAQWDKLKIKQLKKETGQALLSDERTLVSFSHDFGNLVKSQPVAVYVPTDFDSLQSFIRFANQNQLPITIRGNGLSQCGQSLPISGGVTLSMQPFSKPLGFEQDSIWVEANTSWVNLLNKTLLKQKAPMVLPYNCNLAVGGVLSVGGVGAASFKNGTISAHVKALEVIDGKGIRQIVDKASPLYHACLSGLGRFGVITKACIQLRPVKKQVKTFSLVYQDPESWFDDLEKVKGKADYIELFCSPAILAMQLKGGKRIPKARWLYALHVSLEYEGSSPKLEDLGIKPWDVISTQEDTILSYFLRHDTRFEMMKLIGQWDLLHPWYECLTPLSVIKKILPDLLNELPLHFANLVHVVPIAKKEAGFLMFPDSESVCSLMILNPGIPYQLEKSCLDVVDALDKQLIKLGGKRYLSGFLGKKLPSNYWAKHFDNQYNSWIDLKKRYDPNGIFSSLLQS